MGMHASADSVSSQVLRFRVASQKSTYTSKLFPCSSSAFRAAFSSRNRRHLSYPCGFSCCWIILSALLRVVGALLPSVNALHSLDFTVSCFGYRSDGRKPRRLVIWHSLQDITPVPATSSHTFVDLDLDEKGEQQSHFIHPGQDRKYWKLPRIYVGPRQEMRDNNSLMQGSLTHLSSEQTHYLVNVMRIFRKKKNVRVDGSGIELGDCIRIFNGEDGEWLAKIHRSSPANEDEPITGDVRSKRRRRSPKQKKDPRLVAQCILQLREQSHDRDGDGKPWIFFSPLKKQPRMKVFIEKCTELGVGRFVPVLSDRMDGTSLMALSRSYHGGKSDSKEKEGSSRKLEIQCIEAAEQCERLDIPKITDGVIFKRFSSEDTLWDAQNVVKKWCSDWSAVDGQDVGRDAEARDDEPDDLGQERQRVLLICRERSSDHWPTSGSDTKGKRPSIVPLLDVLKHTQRVAFLVGPEGGWSIEEEKVFDDACSKYRQRVISVSLGSTVLRAETASFMAIGAWALATESQKSENLF